MDTRSSRCPHSKLLAVRAPNRKEDPEEPAVDRRRGRSRLLCAKQLHTAGKYRH
ncbi:unnamed protein product, partial [Staurois parvus]